MPIYNNLGIDIVTPGADSEQAAIDRITWYTDDVTAEIDLLSVSSADCVTDKMGLTPTLPPRQRRLDPTMPLNLDTQSME
jgi:hypothetical protein